MGVRKITRTIQWYGLLRFPELGENERIHWWRLLVDMRRRPKGEYRNDGVWQPPRGFWGNVCLRRDGRVVKSAQLEFPAQIVMQESYSEVYLHQAISCHLDAVLKSIANLGEAFGGIVISRVNPIRGWSPYSLTPSDFSIKMISENAIADFILEYDIIPICAVDMSAVGEAPPPPQTSPGQSPADPEQDPGLPISDAYDGDKDGGETYDPDPGSDEPEYPIGATCAIYSITVRYRQIGLDPQAPGDFATALFYGPIEDIYLGKYEPSDTTNSILVRSGGRIDIQECSPGQIAPIVAYQMESFEVMEIEEVESGG